MKIKCKILICSLFWLFSPCGELFAQWTYANLNSYNSAVVRVYAEHGTGSGVYITWKNRPLILTVNHVVENSPKIIIWLSNGQVMYARVLKVDVEWDIAVLKPLNRVKKIVPAEVDTGLGAMCKVGDKLESFGWGPDGKLACNKNSFIQYTNKVITEASVKDWMIIKGYAREGDSGGGVFKNGKLIGILWGFDGEVIYGTQVGRLHLILNETIK